MFAIAGTTLSGRKENFSYLGAPAAKDFLTGEKAVLILQQIKAALSVAFEILQIHR